MPFRPKTRIVPLRRREGWTWVLTLPSKVATACFVEWEEYRSVLIAAQRRLRPRPPIWDNVKTFDGRPWRGLIDTDAYGYPCQPFSQAGQRKGEDDPRHLWPDVARIVGEVPAGMGIPRKRPRPRQPWP